MRGRQQHLTPAFVEFVPDQLDPGVLYVSMPYKTVVHLCCCGCGAKVVTPLSPTGWSLTYNGRAVDLSPSIGNWNLPCKSHYWISSGRVRWAGRWTDEEIEQGFERDRSEKRTFFEKVGAEALERESEKTVPPTRLWGKLRALLTRRSH